MFICLEGAHAVGKTTQCLLLKEKIEKEFGKLQKLLMITINK